MQIVFTEKESKIISILLKVHASAGLKEDMRIAGGWVRDKLLGKSSDDIDIALDGITGTEFEVLVRLHSGNDIDKSFVVERNPERSKHLETVGVVVCGQKIDLVNLRSESYSDTRIPDVAMGTPLEDARRRDLTINALFYNINKGIVEDFTGQGLEDLKSLILRTPLDPRQTFLDDPLRTLRVLRFRSQFGDSTLCPNVVKALALDEVQDAYRQKVAPERAGPEIVKMFKGETPCEAVAVLLKTGLYKAVFDVPEMQGIELDMDQRSSYHKLGLLGHTIETTRIANQLCLQDRIGDETRAKIVMAAMLHDYGKGMPGIARPHAQYPEKMTYYGHEQASRRVSRAILKRIGIGDKDRAFVTRLVGLHMVPTTYKKATISQKSIGKLLRKLRIEGYAEGNFEDPSQTHILRLRQVEADNMWRYLYLLCMADSMGRGLDASDDVELKYRHLAQIRQYVLDPPCSKALIDGHELMSMFPNLVPGKWISETKHKLLEAQEGRLVTNREEALEFVRNLDVTQL